MSKIIVTNHFRERFRQRQARTKRIEVFAERAFLDGTNPSSFEFKRFAKQLTKKEAAYGSVAKIYNGFVYWFFGNRAITIYPLPTKYKAYRK